MSACVAWGRLTFLGLLVLLTSCGLEPRYAQLPPPANDGQALWVTVGTAPPDDYVPLLLGDPPAGVCRARFEPSQGSTHKSAGYFIGEIDTAGICRVTNDDTILTYHEQFEQLQLRAGIAYAWVTRDELRPDRTYYSSKLWADNAVPIEPMRYSDGSYDTAWLPCAAHLDGRWRIGQLELNVPPDAASCRIPGEVRVIAVRRDYRALYVPLDQ